jgi:hypothetical protein
MNGIDCKTRGEQLHVHLWEHFYLHHCSNYYVVCLLLEQCNRVSESRESFFISACDTLQVGFVGSTFADWALPGPDTEFLPRAWS